VPVRPRGELFSLKVFFSGFLAPLAPSRSGASLQKKALNLNAFANAFVFLESSGVNKSRNEFTLHASNKVIKYRVESREGLLPPLGAGKMLLGPEKDLNDGLMVHWKAQPRDDKKKTQRGGR